MAELRDTDLMLVNRDGTSYAITGEDLKLSTGAKISDPTPDLTTASPALAGSGTQANPYVIPAADCFKGGDVYSDSIITFSGLVPASLVTFTDENGATNGGNFQQPIGTVDQAGNYSFRMYFKDNVGAGLTAYTGLIKSGTVYFTWTVNVLDKGIETPVIESMQDLSGAMLTPPFAPTYVTESTVSNAIPVQNLTGLNDGETAELTASGGDGSGLKFKVLIIDGKVDSVEITQPGSGYGWLNVVTVNLSSYGGTSGTQFTVYTAPVAGASLLLQTSDFVSDNAGNFEAVEWEFSKSELFTDSTLSTTPTQPGGGNNTPISNSYNVENGEIYYFRIRYKSDDGTVSGWSKTARTAGGPTIVFEYQLNEFIPGLAFNSGPVRAARIPYTYLSVTCNLKPDGSEKLNGESGVVGEYGGNTNCFKDGDCNIPDIESPSNKNAGKPVRCMIFLQVRQPIRFVVGQIGAGGTVTELAEHPDDLQKLGLPDYIKYEDPSLDVTTVTGSGSGLKIHLRQTPEGYTRLAGWEDDTGSGYAVGDIVSWQGAVGDGTGKKNNNGTVSKSGSLDLANDIIIHGMPGRGGQDRAGYLSEYVNGAYRAGSNTCNGTNPNWSVAWIPVPDFSNPYTSGGQQSQRGKNCNGQGQNSGPGGGGGAGWTGGGHGASNGTNAPGQPGGTGGEIINPLVSNGSTFETATFDGIYLYYNYNNETFLKVKPVDDTSKTFEYVRIN